MAKIEKAYSQNEQNNKIYVIHSRDLGAISRGKAESLLTLH